MFHPHLAERGLFTPGAVGPDSDVLNRFPSSVRLQLLPPVVAALETNDHEDLCSETQVLWATEVVGHSFALGPAHIGVVTSAIAVYDRWLRKSSDSGYLISDNRAMIVLAHTHAHT